MVNRSDISVRSYGADMPTGLVEKVFSLYAVVFAEPPYGEGTDDVDDFKELFDIEMPQPGFELVTAEVGTELVGFGYGYSLRAETRWWEGTAPAPDPAFTAERDGRTFVVKELAVVTPYRRQGVGRRLHDTLLDRRDEERATLTVRPEATAATTAYASWGWSAIGTTEPVAGDVEYLVMVRSLA